MKRLTSLMSGILCLVLMASTAWAYSSYDLDRANRTRDRGDFFEARRLYSTIASDEDYTSDTIRRQAGYFVGFCSIRLSEPENAIKDYRRFLRNFDGGYDETLIPDALYVLGRTYETVNDRYEAKDCYRECIERFRGEFPRKCKERLLMMGEYDSDSPYLRTVESRSTGAAASARKLSGTDPFDGFQMDLQQEKVDQLRNKFETLHAHP